MYIKKSFEHNEAELEGVNGRRSIRRRHLIYYLRVWDVDAKTMLGHVVDITTDGMMLISDKPIELNKKFNLEIRWQDEHGKAKHISFEAESRWDSTDVNAAFCDTGFKILNEGIESLAPIRELIDEYGFND